MRADLSMALMTIFFILQEGQENNKTAIIYNPNRIGRGIFFDGTKGDNGF